VGGREPAATGATASTALRAARVARGWSQSDAARALVALAQTAGAPVAAAASLKSLLSRWENGHAVPEAQYRELLAQLYEHTPAELGIEGTSPEPDAGDGRERLLEALAAARAAERAGTTLWWEQLAAATRLDDELGAAGAGELVRAQAERLEETLTHTTSAPHRAAVAAVLAWTAVLAGAHELDRAHPDRAWRRYASARFAAREAEEPAAEAVAVAGQAAVLVDVGETRGAVALLDSARPSGSAAAEARLDAARAVARAAAGDAAAARAAIAAVTRRIDHAAPVAIDAVRPDGRPVVELADLHRWHGRALVAMGDAAAVGPLEQALADAPRSARHRAAVHADLALALAVEHPEAAAGHARTAREIARGIGSRRIVARLADLPRHR
jgi:transcriptional regulator with XRE-family HTH domain